MGKALVSELESLVSLRTAAVWEANIVDVDESKVDALVAVSSLRPDEPGAVMKPVEGIEVSVLVIDAVHSDSNGIDVCTSAEIDVKLVLESIAVTT